jgi:hypothetical protein
VRRRGHAIRCEVTEVDYYNLKREAAEYKISVSELIRRLLDLERRDGTYKDPSPECGTYKKFRRGCRCPKCLSAARAKYRQWNKVRYHGKLGADALLQN